jgi:hypothetical protein
MHHYSLMEESIPEDQRQGDMYGGEVTEVATDDPRWTAACHQFNDAFRKSDEIALAMLDTPIMSVEGLVALLAYAGEHSEQGLLWPKEIINETVDDKPQDWERWVLKMAAETMRRLSAPAVTMPTIEERAARDSEIGRAPATKREQFAEAFQELEADVCDFSRSARLAELQLHQAIGDFNVQVKSTPRCQSMKPRI